MTPEQRFRMNEGAKTRRLLKMRKRLEAATPSSRSFRGRGGLAFRWLWLVALGLVFLALWRRF